MPRAAVVPDARQEPARQGQLAIALQEVLTAIVRVRDNRQSVTDAATFRNHIKQLITAAHEHARRAGFASADVKLAIYAVVVFLDESILNSPLPALAEWSRKPLQEELFGEHMGGQVFFDHLRDLVGRQDTEDLAEVLEVYELCLLLGFRGKFGAAGQNEVQRWALAAGEKIARIRGAPPQLAPFWPAPERETFPVQRDPWLRQLAITALGLASAAIVVWIILSVVLGSSISQLRSLPLTP